MDMMKSSGKKKYDLSSLVTKCLNNGGRLEFSESDDNTLEVLGGSRSLGVWLA